MPLQTVIVDRLRRFSGLSKNSATIIARATVLLAATLVVGACASTSGNLAFPGQAISPERIRPVSPSNAYDTPPKFLRGYAPFYPIRQLKMRRPGEAILQFDVALDGTTANIRVVSSNGYAFWKQTMFAVEKWRFAPALKNGRPVVVRMQVGFEFKG